MSVLMCFQCIDCLRFHRAEYSFYAHACQSDRVCACVFAGVFIGLGTVSLLDACTASHGSDFIGLGTDSMMGAFPCTALLASLVQGFFLRWFVSSPGFDQWH